MNIASKSRSPSRQCLGLCTCLMAFTSPVLGQLPDNVGVYSEAYVGGLYRSQVQLSGDSTPTNPVAAIEGRGNVTVLQRHADEQSSLTAMVDRQQNYDGLWYFTAANLEGRRFKLTPDGSYDLRLSSFLVKWDGLASSPDSSDTASKSVRLIHIENRVSASKALAVNSVSSVGAEMGLGARRGTGEGTNARAQVYVLHSHSQIAKSRVSIGYSTDFAESRLAYENVAWAYSHQWSILDKMEFGLGYGQAQQEKVISEKFVSATASWMHQERKNSLQLSIGRDITTRPITHVQAVAMKIDLDARMEMAADHLLDAKIAIVKEQVVLRAGTPATLTKAFTLMYDVFFGDYIRGLTEQREFMARISGSIETAANEQTQQTKTLLAGLTYHF
jgi:hypothetical protein